MLAELGVSAADIFEKKFESFMLALKVFKKLHGHLRVPRNYIVPSSPPWPSEVHGLKLGMMVSSTRTGASNRTPERVARLQEIGFVWDALQLASNITIAALTAFKENYGHVDVPKSFVVPRNNMFPEETWGLRLGSRISNLRYRGDGDVELRAVLQEVGLILDYTGFDNRHWEYVYR